ncbi:OmpA family protein [Arundinibacter roseus]|uniref:OmpA family protein n=1 Tax=Arundinibacter roseus TaxID=2070510 RepID=A0A4R4KG93_9BACT|nr:OmpA family protein [Arundinibacter roseus]TDB67064.1 OmpA family protein [Arundinibacter roseus]
MKKILIIAAAGLMLTVGISGCKNSKLSRQEKGAIIGVGSGAAAGAVIGRKSGNTAVGAIIGAAVGGTAGTLIGVYMDKQARELEQKVENAKVERIGEGIKMTFDSGLLFGFDSYDLTAETRTNLDNLAEVVKEYDDTDILIEGHTDDVGAEDYNRQLSERRAKAVADYLRDKKVTRSRLRTEGYGENQPIVSNDTKRGQDQNRRVEIVITASEKLKKNVKKEVSKEAAGR